MAFPIVAKAVQSKFKFRFVRPPGSLEEKVFSRPDASAAINAVKLAND